MKLKLRIFALMAMLLCFAFQANAQFAKIGETDYSTLGDALTAAREMSGDVTVEVYDRVTLNTAFSGRYSSINFVGKDTDAEIYLDVQGYITATGKKVSFTDLTLSKSEGGSITNAGFMNVAFGVYDVVEVAYTNCVFANGAYASSGNVTYTNCTFKKSWDKYGLWAYGDVDVTVDACVFDNYRGIKMYAEGKAKTTELTVKNTNFSALGGGSSKPAIVLTYGASVVLEKNTYSRTGTFELDLDGDPNGTAVTSDVAPVCVNDNGACGVLVDGKIYTTVAQAAEVATEGSNVTLLYSTTDTVEFAEGVNLTLANGVTADNVTVIVAGLKGEGTAASPFLINNVDDLVWFQKKVDELAADGSTQFAGKYFKLTADINLADINWNPIGSMSGDHGSFKGVFDGDNHTISNLNVEQNGNGIGLFARTAGNAVIKNLKLNNVTVKSTDNSNYVGGVVGNAYASTKIENVHLSGNIYISGRGYIGGIAGHGYVVMDNVSVVATGDGQGNDKGLVTSTFWCAGGILGYGGEGATNIMNANVENVVVTSAAGGLGAIVGMAEDNDGTQPISGSNLSASNVEIKTYTGAYGDSYANYALGYLYGGNPTSKLTGEIKVENVGITTSNGVAPSVNDAVAQVNDAIFFSLQDALNAAAAGTGNVTVTILKDVDLTDVTWTPVRVSEPGYPEVTVEGNYKTITGLTDMLFAGTWAGGSGLIIKNLTIANSAIENDKEDSEGTVGVGAFIGYPQASATITLENCHLKNSSVEGGHWTGGLIGMAGGYNGTDGPVFMNLTIKGCSVTGSTITGKGSAGGVIGHGSCAAWTNVVIKGTTVSGNTITSTGSSTNKAGAVMGTIGAAGQATTVNGVTNTGGASVSATVANNDVKSNGTEITTIYGRQGSETGMLYVAGGSYDNYPIEQGVAYAAPVEGYVIVKNADDKYGLDEKVELPEVVITDIKGSLTESDPDLTFALNFSIKDLENLDEEYINKVMEQYGSWYTDYVLTISGLTDENVTFNSDGSGDGYLAGQYDGFGPNWVSVPFEDVTLTNNESIYIMEYAAKLMGQSGLRYTLAEIVSIVQNFDCGVYFSPEFLTANPGLEVDLHLKVFTEDAEGNKVNDINVATNEFDIADYVAIVHADGKQTTYCTTLAAAVAAAEADETITLIADVELTETLTIPADKTVALDLNGKTISQTKEQTAGYQMILNDGNLTIDDSSESKAGKISYTDSGNGGEYISDVIYNRSVLVINGGTIENLSSATVASNGYPHAVDTYSGIRDTYVEINGGTIYCAEYSAIRMFCVSATNKADLVINGGTIKGAVDMQNGTKEAALGTLTINGGTFEITKNANNIRFANWNGGATEYGVSAEIKGGSFNGGITTTYVPAAANWNKGIISGGTYAKDMTEYCADGYVCKANADGTYGIVNDPGYAPVWTFDDSNSEDYTNNTVLTVGTLTFKRTFIAGIWNPLYLPFDIELTDELLDKFEFYEYNQMLSTDTDGDRVPDDFAMELFVFQGGTLEANYPYFVRPKNAEACTMEVVMNNAYLYAADENSFETASMKNIFTLSGTHKSMTADELAGKFVMSTEGKWQPAGSNMKSHRLYLSITDRNGNSIASKAIRMVVRGEDGFEGTTGVDIVETDNAADGTIYDLSGRPVVEPVKGGMYIINGKKVVY